MMSPLPDDWRENDRPGWDDELADIFEAAFRNSPNRDRLWNDSALLDVFHDGFINRDIGLVNKNRARDMFHFWAYDDYGIDFSDEFDWDAFVEWKSPETAYSRATR